MTQYIGRLIRVEVNEDGSCTGLVMCPPGLRSQAGQYLLAQPVGQAGAAPVALFLAGEDLAGLEAVEIPRGWSVGDDLHLRGPLGKGFSPPQSAKRWLLVAPFGHLRRLLPLVSLALARGADLAVHSASFPADLPLSAEVIPAGQLAETLAWADYLAADLTGGDLRSLRARLGIPESAPFPCPSQALVDRAMPCGGLADCGACAVYTRAGWQLACHDGPVFDLNVLEDE